MKRINPKSHDSLFKWLITSFTAEFFEHYFPGVRIGQYRFIDKEFISKYEALKESLKGDLFLLTEAEIDGEFREIAVQPKLTENSVKSPSRSNIRAKNRICRNGFSNISVMYGC